MAPVEDRRVQVVENPLLVSATHALARLLPPKQGENYFFFHALLVLSVALG